MNWSGGIGMLLAGALICGVAGAQNSFGEQVKPAAPTPQTLQPGPEPSAPIRPTPPPEPPRAQSPDGRGPEFSRARELESRDYGIAATASLHSGPMHGPTPTSIPGGRTVSTETVFTMMQRDHNSFLLLDVLGGQQYLPSAQAAAAAAAPGSYDDQTQQQFGQYLAQASGGDSGFPLVLYCQSPQCWMSYNAALRAIALGYTQVLWYRGGLEAWQAAGLPTQTAY